MLCLLVITALLTVGQDGPRVQTDTPPAGTSPRADPAPPSSSAAPNRTPVSDADALRALGLYQQGMASSDLAEQVKLFQQATSTDPTMPNYLTAYQDARQKLEQQASDASAKQSEVQKEAAAKEQDQGVRQQASARLDEAYEAKARGDNAAARVAAQAAMDLAAKVNEPAIAQQAQRLAALLDASAAARSKALTAAGVVALAALVLAFVFWRKSVRRLDVVDGPEKGRVIKLAKELTTLGSAEGENDIVLADSMRAVSRRHCQIAKSGRHYFLVDCSRNGTFLNGRAVPPNEPVLLHLNDEISLSDEVVLIYR